MMEDLKQKQQDWTGIRYPIKEWDVFIWIPKEQQQWKESHTHTRTK